MRRFFGVVLGLATVTSVTMATVLAAEEASPSATTFSTVEEGKLNVALTGDAPYAMVDGTTLVGIDGEIVSRIGEELGLEVVPNLMDFSAGIESVRSGRVDTLIGGVGWSAERADVMDLTDAIYYVSIAVAQKQDSQIQTLEDMAGKVGGSITGFSLVPELQAVPGIGEVRLYDTNDAVFRDIVEGRLDFALMDPFAVELAAQEHPEWEIKQLPIDASAQAEAFPILGSRVVTVLAVNPESNGLSDAMSGVIRQLWESCEIRDILGTYITPSDAFFEPVVPDPRVGVDRDETYASPSLGAC